MTSEQGPRRALSFGANAEAYERSRPGYPPALFDALFALVGPRPRIIEIGAGTGKATRELIPRAGSVVAIEPDAAMASVLRAAIGDSSRVTIVESDFERSPEAEPAELVVSAQAWHWVDPAIGIPKAHRSLTPAGFLAVWWNRPRQVPGDLTDEFAVIYRRHAPGLVDQGRPGQPWFSTQVALEQLRESGRFGEPEIRNYPWETRRSAEEYVEYLGTLSASTEISREARSRVFVEVHAAIERAGGSIPVAFQTQLVLARPR